MLYLWIKWLHIVSSTILFGTGIGIAFFKWYSDRNCAGQIRPDQSQNAHTQAAILRIVVIADWCFTTPAALTQLMTGLWLAHLAGLPLQSGWIFWALVLYFIVGACWVPVLWLQLQMRSMAQAAAAVNAELPLTYHRYRKIWFALGVPAFLALLAVFYLMVFKPDI